MSRMTPQQRGKRLEQLVHTVLEAEWLRPRGPLRNPGEELDRSFTIENIHYLLECKWEDEPIGFPPVRNFIGKVSRKAEGTFGVFLSMSGFVGDINTSEIFGQRLNCLGLPARSSWTSSKAVRHGVNSSMLHGVVQATAANFTPVCEAN